MVTPTGDLWNISFFPPSRYIGCTPFLVCSSLTATVLNTKDPSSACFNIPFEARHLPNYINQLRISIRNLVQTTGCMAPSPWVDALRLGSKSRSCHRQSRDASHLRHVDALYRDATRPDACETHLQISHELFLSSSLPLPPLSSYPSNILFIPLSPYLRLERRPAHSAHVRKTW